MLSKHININESTGESPLKNEDGLLRGDYSSLDSEHIVSDWREAWIVLGKWGDKNKAIDYPQVSLTSISNKLLEYTI